MKVCFVYAGPLKYRGRLFKQVKTLQDAGHECVLIHGRTEAEQPDYSAYSFPVIPIRVIWEKAKLVTLGSVLLFNQIAAKKIIAARVDAVVCITLESALAGALAKRKSSGLRYIFDSNELTLEMFSSKIKRSVFEKIQDFVLQNADIVMHAEQHRLEYFEKRYPSKTKSFLLENLPYARSLSSRHDTNVVRIVYLGVLSPARHCLDIIRAFAALGGDNICLDIIGYYGRKAYEAEVQTLMTELENDHIRILPPVSHDQIYDVLAKYHIGLAFYSNTNLNNYYCAPNKVYDYIQMGLGVITNDYPGLIDIVENNRVGVCLSELNPNSIRDAITRIQTEGLYSRKCPVTRKRYSWEYQSENYLRLFE